MLESPFNKAAGLKVFNSIKKRLQHSCFLVELAKLLKTPFFTREFQWLLLMFNLLFPKEFEARTGVTVSNKYQRKMKKVFAPAKIQKQPP